MRFNRMKYRLLFFALLLFAFVVPVKARQPAGLTIDVVTSDAESVTVSVDISENSHAAMLQFALGYSEETLVLDSVSSGGVFNGLGAPTLNTREPGHVYFAWDSLGILDDGGTVLLLRFHRTEPTAQGQIFFDENESLVIADSDFTEIPCSVSNVTVPGYTANASEKSQETDEQGREETASSPTEQILPSGTDQGLTINKHTLHISGNGDQKLTIAENEELVFWESSNESVAVVKDGVVSAVGAGDAVITAVSADGLRTASCVVVVESAEERNDTPYIAAALVLTVAAMGWLTFRWKRNDKPDETNQYNAVANSVREES